MLPKRGWTLAVLTVLAVGLLWIAGPAPDGESPPEPERSTRAEDDGKLVDPAAAALRLAPVETFHGVLVNPQGTPVGGARVRQGAEETVSHDNGWFELRRSTAPLEITHAGYFPLTVEDRHIGSSGKDPESARVFVLFPGVRLTGRVVDELGVAIEGATLFFARDIDSKFHEVRTDAGGRWTSPLLPPGTAHVLARHPSYEGRDRTVHSPTAGTRALRDVVLTRGEPLKVRTVDPRGSRLADVQLWLETDPPGGKTTGIESRYLGRTGDLGELEDARPPGRRAWVRALLAGYQETRVAAGEPSIVIRMPPAPAIEAQAIDRVSGLPARVESARLEYLTTDGYRRVPARGVLFHSLEDGNLRVGLPLVPGSYRLVIGAEGSRWGTSEEIRFDGRHAPPPLWIRVDPELRLGGYVTHRDTPVEGVTVECLATESLHASRPLAPLEEPAGPPRTLATAHTDHEGRFELPVTWQQPCRIRVTHPGTAPYLSPPIRVPQGVGEVFPILLREPGHLRGRVTDSDQNPLADAPLVLIEERMGVRDTRTDENGRYEFHDLPPAEGYRLLVGERDSVLRALKARESVRGGAGGEGHAAGAERVAGSVVAVRAGEVTEHELRVTRGGNGSLLVTVLAGGAGRSATLRLTPSGSSGTLEAGLLEGATGADGRCLFLDVPPGTYDLRIEDLALRREVRIEAGRRATARFEIRPVSYRIQGASGSGSDPLPPPWTVELARVSPEGPARVLRRRVTQGTSTTVDSLVPGRYRVRVEARGHLPTHAEVEITEDREDLFRLERGHEVQIRLRTEQGDLFRGEVDVEVLQNGRRVHAGRHRVEDVLTLPPLPRGEYTLIVTAGERVSRSQLILGGGKSTDKIDLRAQ